MRGTQETWGLEEHWVWGKTRNMGFGGTRGLGEHQEREVWGWVGFGGNSELETGYDIYIFFFTYLTAEDSS